MRHAFAVIVLGILAAAAWAQQGDRPDPPAQNGERDQAQSSGGDVKTQVKTILSKYGSGSLTADQAKAINKAFRDAGLRNGPDLKQAIEDAGFSSEKISELDPPPDRAEAGGGRNAERQGQGQGASDNHRGKGDGQTGGRKGRGQAGEGKARQGGGGYNIEQAISDRAQLNTIAFDGLAFLTGDLGGNTFLPPGKVADFCGFQYMRDVDTNQLGHNTSFVPRAANNMLYVLTDAQKAQLVTLAKEQEKMLTDFAYKRFPLVKAFCRQLAGDIPTGSTGLSREAVMKYTAGVFEIDGALSYRRAEVLGGIVRALSDKQKAYLAKMKFNNSATWPEMKDQMDKRSLSHTAHVAVMTYASEMFSWYAGNVEADVYFCPERHATYFGSFYMKDIPAMGNPNYSISTSLTGDSGEAFLAALSDTQRGLVTALVDQQRNDLKEIVSVRRQIATELRRFMKESSIDKAKVMSLSKRYGELDGEISYFYATAFSEAAKTLTADQKKTLLKLRNLDAKYTCKGAYLYSRAIDMPAIPNTDFLFGKGQATKAAPAAKASSIAVKNSSTFVLRSPAVADKGPLPKEFTGDGAAATLPLEWSGAPPAAKSFALVMHHVDPQGKTKWYWVLYNIPAGTTSLAKSVKGVGTLGNNSVNGRLGYAPPHSKGPGAKTYIYTLYALVAPVQVDVEPADVTRDVLLAAMKDKILASARLSVVYTRNVQQAPQEDPQ
ncbi:MAG: hypothetical protein LLG01_05685 [Planctomycetaceae bacterium]|nr:hypothetical protein [Planctomycetaceae bacterium]